MVCVCVLEDKSKSSGGARATASGGKTVPFLPQ